MTKVSVVITSFNQKNLLARAVKSVLAQSLPAHEIIICDDESRDGSREFILDLERKHPDLVRGILQPRNQGISRNRNSGLENASGDFVTWLDGDDLFEPEKLARETALLRQDGSIKWAYSQVLIRREEGDSSAPRYDDPPSGWVFEKILLMLGRAPRNPTIELKALKSAGLFDPAMDMYEDFDLLARLAKRYPCAYSAEPGMVYMIHGQGAHAARKEKHFRNLDLIEKNIAPLLTDVPPGLVREFHDYLAAFRKKIQGRLSLYDMASCRGRGERFRAAGNLCKAYMHMPEELEFRSVARELMRILLTPRSTETRQQKEK